MYSQAVHANLSGTPQSTSATHALIAGLTGTVFLGRRSRIYASMPLSSSGQAGGSAIIGAFAIEINGVQGTEIQRYIATVDQGAIAVTDLSAVLDKGEYLVRGLFRRVSGTLTLQVDTGHLIAYGVAAL